MDPGQLTQITPQSLITAKKNKKNHTKPLQTTAKQTKPHTFWSNQTLIYSHRIVSSTITPKLHQNHTKQIWASPKNKNLKPQETTHFDLTKA